MHTLKRTHDTQTVDGMDLVTQQKESGELCEAWLDGKASKKPHPRKEKTSTKVLELVHADLCGAIDPP